MNDAPKMIARAREIADDVFFPAAAEVDRADRVPAAHLDLLAAEGFYGVAAPPEAGGLGTDMAVAGAMLEAFAGGCLATTFVWLQHHGPVLAAAYSQQPGLREAWLGPLSRGERRAGIALAGIRPGPPRMRVRPAPGGSGFLLDGEVPWVTGWDMIDVVHVAARDPDDVIHYLLVDAAAGETLTVERLDLVAAHASRTVTLRFDTHPVPADRLTRTQPYQDWLTADASGSALNGFLALGVANRCLRLLGTAPPGTASLDAASPDAALSGIALPGTGPLDIGVLCAELDRCRAALLAADATTTPAARAAVSELAVRAAATLAVHTGARAVLDGQDAQRLTREATFLLVFGSRPAIRDALLARLTQPPPAPPAAARPPQPPPGEDRH